MDNEQNTGLFSDLVYSNFDETVVAQNLKFTFWATGTMNAKTTFSQESLAWFRQQVALAESEFVLYPAYAGTAVHMYRALNEKSDEEQSDSDDEPSSDLDSATRPLSGRAWLMILAIATVGCNLLLGW